MNVRHTPQQSRVGHPALKFPEARLRGTFQEQVFLESPKRSKRVLKNQPVVRRGWRKLLENSAPAASVVMLCRKALSGGAAKPQVLQGSLWAFGLSRNHILLMHSVFFTGSFLGAIVTFAPSPLLRTRNFREGRTERWNSPAIAES